MGTSQRMPTLRHILGVIQTTERLYPGFKVCHQSGSFLDGVMVLLSPPLMHPLLPHHQPPSPISSHVHIQTLPHSDAPRSGFTDHSPSGRQTTITKSIPDSRSPANPDGSYTAPRPLKGVHYLSLTPDSASGLQKALFATSTRTQTRLLSSSIRKSPSTRFRPVCSRSSSGVYAYCHT
ncbi:hypothetical protein BD779DRAFT_122153 [Infundibulicybe gibba]|nr:hypothetical protein BD779DRAFT_122153 [Infundibulicybe gibba]